MYIELLHYHAVPWGGNHPPQILWVKEYHRQLQLQLLGHLQVQVQHLVSIYLHVIPHHLQIQVFVVHPVRQRAHSVPLVRRQQVMHPLLLMPHLLVPRPHLKLPVLPAAMTPTMRPTPPSIPPSVH